MNCPSGLSRSCTGSNLKKNKRRIDMAWLSQKPRLTYNMVNSRKNPVKTRVKILLICFLKKMSKCCFDLFFKKKKLGVDPPDSWFVSYTGSTFKLNFKTMIITTFILTCYSWTDFELIDFLHEYFKNKK